MFPQSTVPSHTCIKNKSLLQLSLNSRSRKLRSTVICAGTICAWDLVVPGKRVTFPPTEPTVLLPHPLLHYVACVSEKNTNLPVTHSLATPNMPVNKNIAYHNCAPFSDNMKQGIEIN